MKIQIYLGVYVECRFAVLIVETFLWKILTRIYVGLLMCNLMLCVNKQYTAYNDAWNHITLKPTV